MSKSKFFNVIATWKDGEIAYCEVNGPYEVDSGELAIGDEVPAEDMGIYPYLIHFGRALCCPEELDELKEVYKEYGEPSLCEVAMLLPEEYEVIKQTQDRVLYHLKDNDMLFISELGENGKTYYYGEDYDDNRENAEKHL